MTLPLQLQTFYWEQQQLQLYVPDPSAVLQQYRLQKEKDPTTSFPYWAQVWPAALAMTSFILHHPQYIAHKKIIELAAGLGMPSLLAARQAESVICSDYLPEAVAVIEQSIAYNGLQNVHCTTIDWHNLYEAPDADVLILSDINYDPAEFEVLYTVLNTAIKKEMTILLSTPQRLMAKPFIERLLPWCIYQQEIPVQQGEQIIPITLFVLKQTQ